ncbi:MAG TPA: sulfurtransferase [Gammaproteobacteria bacterium]|nr:sulfurtransferase [Gammaproteobacteria bacterium]
MLPATLPLLLEPAELEQWLGTEGLLVVAVTRPESYAQQHVPGAVYLDYSKLVSAQPPVLGLVPSDAQLSQVFSALGMTGRSHVVAYDDEGGAKAARLLWTLDVIGHPRYSLLDGGWRAWLAGGHSTSSTAPDITPSDYRVRQRGDAMADKAYILAHLHDPTVALLDARTPAEYRGTDKRALRGGHIPGAVNLEWNQALDAHNAMRLKPLAELRAQLSALGVTPDKEVITYCQTHHRSSHSYIVLTALGYPRIKGYPGAWSEWGNSSDAPVEQ